MSTGDRRASLLVLSILVVLLGGCRQDMQDSPYLEPFEAHDFFDDGSANRPLPAGTVARGLLKDDTHYWFGRDEAGQYVADLPAKFEWSRELLERGQDRFEIYCSVCHDSSGAGRGMIVQRGFKQPQPLYEDRLQEMPLGYFYDVATNGFGIMPSYKNQVPVDDRWALAAYVRVLQVSQGSRLEELPPAVQASFRQAMAGMQDGGAAYGSGSSDQGSYGSDPGGSASDPGAQDASTGAAATTP